MGGGGPALRCGRRDRRIAGAALRGARARRLPRRRARACGAGAGGRGGIRDGRRDRDPGLHPHPHGAFRLLARHVRAHRLRHRRRQGGGHRPARGGAERLGRGGPPDRRLLHAGPPRAHPSLVDRRRGSRPGAPPLPRMAAQPVAGDSRDPETPRLRRVPSHGRGSGGRRTGRARRARGAQARCASLSRLPAPRGFWARSGRARQPHLGAGRGRQGDGAGGAVRTVLAQRHGGRRGLLQAHRAASRGGAGAADRHGRARPLRAGGGERARSGGALGAHHRSARRGAAGAVCRQGSRRRRPARRSPGGSRREPPGPGSRRSCAAWSSKGARVAASERNLLDRLADELARDRTTVGIETERRTERC